MLSVGAVAVVVATRRLSLIDMGDSGGTFDDDEYEGGSVVDCIDPGSLSIRMLAFSSSSIWPIEVNGNGNDDDNKRDGDDNNNDDYGNLYSY